MDSQTTGWTKVGKGGKPVEFPPEAAAAFGSKKSRVQASASAPSVEFPEIASSAFGRRERRGTRGVEPIEFDSTAAAAFGRSRPSAAHDSLPPIAFDTTAASAFGSKPRAATHGGFDDRAAAAFGTSGSAKSDFPSSFGKKRPGFGSAAAEFGFDDAEADGKSWNLSAFARKKAEAQKPAPPKKQTYEELFPVLGAAAAAPVAAPAAAAPAAPKPTWGAKTSFADVMKKRVAIETAEAELAAQIEHEKRELEAQLAYDRRIQRSLHNHRLGNSVVYEGEDEMADSLPQHGDLDVDGYGELRRELHTVEKREPVVSDSESEEEEAPDDDCY